MSRTPLHPTREQIELPIVLDCLADPIRLAIVYQLALQEHASREPRCGDFSNLGGKSNLAYHFAKLRKCGVTQMRVAGTNRFLRLRREDLEARFPSLLDAVINSAAKDAGRLQSPSGCDASDTERTTGRVHLELPRLTGRRRVGRSRQPP